MSTLTKEQFEQLPIEQQEALGKIELHRIKRRQLLLKQTRHSHVYMLVTIGYFIATYAVLYFLAKSSPPTAITLSFAFSFASASFLNGATNRRVEALLNLLEDDLNADDDPKRLVVK